MKNREEYKVLKYLSENDNGEYIDISSLIQDKHSLRRILIALRKEKYINYFNRYEEYTQTRSELAKIEFLGIKYLESIKPEKMPIYQKIYLPIFIIFGLATIYFAYINYDLNRNNLSLKNELDSSKVKFQIYKDSVEILKLKIERYKTKSTIDTLKTKN